MALRKATITYLPLHDIHSKEINCKWAQGTPVLENCKQLAQRIKSIAVELQKCIYQLINISGDSVENTQL